MASGGYSCNFVMSKNSAKRLACKRDLRARDRDVWNFVRDETETIRSRDRDVETETSSLLISA